MYTHTHIYATWCHIGDGTPLDAGRTCSTSRSVQGYYHCCYCMIVAVVVTVMLLLAIVAIVFTV